jgi:N-acyl-D-amino-acid deacylase
MDVVFRDATVIDGTGMPRRRAHVVVAGGRIAGVVPAGAGPAPSGTRTIDADGLVLAPGFIDMHAHSDLALLAEPAHLAKVSQGVTCELLGQDGLSYAPVDDVTLPQLRQQIAGWHGDPANLRWSWRSVGEYLDRLDGGTAINACYLVPQGNLRALVMGWSDRPSTTVELDRMRDLLSAGLDEGAVGMSSGLTYPPSMYAGTDELVELCRVVARHGGFYVPHHRSYGAGALAAYTEMIEVSRQSDCPVHLTHATLNFAVNAGRAPQLLALFDAALADGVDVSLDSYPYLDGCTTLAALLPSWVADTGGPAAVLARLSDPAARERIRVDMEERGSDGNHGVPVDWHAVRVSGVRDPALADRVGATIADLAAAAGQPPAQVCFDLLLADRLGTTVLLHVGNEENVRTIMRHRRHLIGSDGVLVGDRPHPRAWGTFPRYLGHYVRKLGLLTLEECVARMTGRAARRLRLADRGLVREGYVADLVLFDPETVADMSTMDEPRRQCAGIWYVYVNGVAVIEGGQHTGALPGRALRRTRGGTVKEGG